MDKDKLVQLLLASQTPDTKLVQSATRDLRNNYYKRADSILLLIEVAITNENNAVRQSAAVQALRLGPRHWQHIDTSQKSLALSHLLDVTLKEKNAAIRHAFARLLSGLIGLDMDIGGAGDVVQRVLPLNNSDDVQSREVGSYIMYSMLDENPARFEEHTHQLLQMFGVRMNDPDSKEVRMNIIQALGAILLNIEPEKDPEALQAVQSFVPNLVSTLQSTVEADDEESYQQIFDVLHSYLASDPSFLAAHLQDLLKFIIALASNRDVEEGARNQALGFLLQAIHYRRLKVQGMKDLAAELMLKAMDIITELDADEDEDDMSPARAAISLVSVLASELHPRLVAVPMLEKFKVYATHPEPAYRVCAMLALGKVAEGAPEFTSTQITSLLPTVINLLRDPHISVRHAALVGLIHLGDEMADEMASHHEQLILAVLENLDSASHGAADKNNTRIVRCACGALDTFGDALDTKIMAQYGPNLVNPMMKLLDHEDYSIRAAASSAVGAIAASMGQDFEPFFKGAMENLGRFVTIKESDEAMELRAATCDSLGRIAVSVGPEAFQPYVMELMKASEEALHLDNPRLKETSFILWSNLSKVYGTDFGHFLEGIFKAIFSSLELEEEEFDIPGLDPSELGDNAVIGGRRIKLKAPTSEEDAEAGWEDLSDDGSEDLEELGAVTAVALEQEIAIDTLGDVVSNSCTSSHLEMYVEQFIEKVHHFTQHTYEGCRRNAFSTLWRIFCRVYQVWEEGSGNEWQPGVPSKQTPPSSILKIGNSLLQITLGIWSDDTDRIVINEINRNMSATLKACGPILLECKEGVMQEIIHIITSIIDRSHPCQFDLGATEEDQEVDVGSSESDWIVVDTALDVLVGLSAALGSQFQEVWKIFEKSVLKLVASTEDAHRSASVGVIAEVSKYTKEAISPFTGSLAQNLTRRLSDHDQLTKSNAAYAIGLLILNSSDTATTFPLFPQLYEKLETMLTVPDTRCADNAAGCLCRMMMKHPDREFVAQALPAVVQVLPLTKDFEENQPVYDCLFKLYSHGDPTIQQLSPQLLGIFDKVLAEPEDHLETDSRQTVQRMVQALRG